MPCRFVTKAHNVLCGKDAGLLYLYALEPRACNRAFANLAAA